MKKIIELIKLHKFYSLTMILSVAVTICFLMSAYIYYTINNDDIGPEVNRSRTASVFGLPFKGVVDDEEKVEFTSYNTATAKEIMKNIEAVDFYTLSGSYYHIGTGNVFVTNNNARISLESKVQDEKIWRMLSYEFAEGRPYTREDIESGSKVVVISEYAAFQLFDRTTNIVGEELYSDMSGDRYKIIGVVKNFSAFYNYAFSDLWFPLPDEPTIKFGNNYDVITDKHVGNYSLNVILKPGYSFNDYQEQYLKSIDEFNLSYLGGEEYMVDLSKYRNNNGLYYRRRSMFGDSEMKIIIIAIMSIILIIPVINGFGISSSYISSRLSEIAIRKVYGANDKQLILQLIMENFFITIAGALVGFFASSYVAKVLLMMIITADRISRPQLNYIPAELMFNYKTFAVMLLFTILFNALSVYIPARRATKLPITTTIKGD